ncbi:DNA alkylation repair protein [Streptococcus orisasini]
MTYSEIIKLFEENSDSEKAAKMANYQKKHFAFYGIPTPLRRQLSKTFLKEKSLEEVIDWEFVFAMWQEDCRECQYLVCNYLQMPKIKSKLTLSDLSKIKELVVSKSWWDSVDNLDEVAGAIVKNDSQAKEIMLEWSLADNFWLRRVAIDHQLTFKKDTDENLLAAIIENNLSGSAFAKEFFINKAIGWALREYSKTNPIWVHYFIEKHKEQMDRLSVREASKYL